MFDDAEVIGTPSGSCAAMIREGYPRLAAASGDEVLARRVRELGERVTLHPTCHSLVD